MGSVRWPLRSTASNSLNTFVPRPWMSRFPVPSEQTTMFLPPRLGAVTAWTSVENGDDAVGRDAISRRHGRRCRGGMSTRPGDGARSTHPTRAHGRRVSAAGRVLAEQPTDGVPARVTEPDTAEGLQDDAGRDAFHDRVPVVARERLRVGAA